MNLTVVKYVVPLGKSIYELYGGDVAAMTKDLTEATEKDLLPTLDQYRSYTIRIRQTADGYTVEADLFGLTAGDALFLSMEMFKEYGSKPGFKFSITEDEE